MSYSDFNSKLAKRSQSLLARAASLSPEDDGVEVERVLDDAGGGGPHAQNVLLGGQVVPARYPLQIRQVAGRQAGGQVWGRDRHWRALA